MNIFAGNLSFEAVESDIKKLFGGFGKVLSVVIPMNKKGVKSRGFCFIEMSDSDQAYKAIAALDGQIFMGRPMKVSAYRKTDDPVSLAPAPASAPAPVREIKQFRLKAEDRRKQPKHWEKRDQETKRTDRKFLKNRKPWERKEDGRPRFSVDRPQRAVSGRKKSSSAISKRTPGKSRSWEKRPGVPAGKRAYRGGTSRSGR